MFAFVLIFNVLFVLRFYIRQKNKRNATGHLTEWTRYMMACDTVKWLHGVLWGKHSGTLRSKRKYIPILSHHVYTDFIADMLLYNIHGPGCETFQGSLWPGMTWLRWDPFCLGFPEVLAQEVTAHAHPYLAILWSKYHIDFISPPKHSDSLPTKQTWCAVYMFWLHGAVGLCLNKNPLLRITTSVPSSSCLLLNFSLKYQCKGPCTLQKGLCIFTVCIFCLEHPKTILHTR